MTEASMSSPGPLAEILGQLAYQFSKIQPLLPTYIHVILSALFPIYAAAHASLTRPSSAAKPEEKSKESGDEDDDESEDEYQRMEGLSPSDAVLFPIMAGITLASLYFLIKWLQDPAILNKILNWYFGVVGIYGVCKFISDAFHIIHSFTFPDYYSGASGVWHVNSSLRKAYPLGSDGNASRFRLSPLPGIFGLIPLPAKATRLLWDLRELPKKKLTLKFYIHRVVAMKTRIDLYDSVAITLGIVAVFFFNLVAKPWWLTNLMGFAFSYSALQLLSPTTFGTGSLVLAGLFLYDIYMVFFTPMMVTVAKSLDIPIKLLFPRPQAADEESKAPSYAMLGLGDIVLPGIVMGLALRYDLYRHYLRKQTSSNPADASKDSGGSSVVMAKYVSPSKNWSNHFWTSPRFGLKLPGTELVEMGEFSKTYFNASLVGYVVGMVSTLIAMHLSDHPQPALLYLVPGVLVSLWLTAMFRGELLLMWDFSDAEEDEKSLEEKSKKSESAQGATEDPGNAINGNSEDVDSKPKTNSEKEQTQGTHKRQISQSKVEKLENSFRRDEKLDLIFFSISSNRPPLQSSLPKGDSSLTTSKAVSESATKWVSPRKETSARGDEPPGKRLRTS